MTARDTIIGKISEIEQHIIALQNGPQITQVQIQALERANAGMTSARMYAISLTDDADEIGTLANSAETDIQNTLIEADGARESKQLADGYVAEIEELATEAINADNIKAQDAATQAELFRDEAE